MRRRLADAARSPTAWILAVVFVLHVVGIGWGLPNSDGWDVDGVAPRDFLPGLAATFTPGHFYTYPPLHLALLAVVTLPITAIGFFRASSHAVPDLVAELIQPGYMTAIAYVARAVSVAMSLGIVVFAGRIAEEIRAAELGANDPRVRHAGWCAMAVVGLNASLTYYGKTTNLDVPYLFWSLWSLSVFARALGRGEPRLFRRAFVLAALAIATKDQAYALFLISMPVLLAVHARRQLREVAIAVVIAVGVLLVADAVVFNPTGFAARVRFLTGSASKDFTEYTANLRGRVQVLVDAVRWFDLQYPHVVLVLAAIGIARSRGRLAWLPALVAVSFTVAFNWVSLRTNARFLMPQAIMLAIYAGRAVEALVFARRRVVGRVAVAAIALLALRLCVAVDANLLFDPRYAAERWLRENVKPGETIETYGLNAYLPRFPAGARVVRVGPEPVNRRSPLPGVIEVQDAFENEPARAPTWIVLSVAWGWRYLTSTLRPGTETNGRTFAPGQKRESTEAASEYFLGLSKGAGTYQFHGEMYELAPWLPLVDVHGTSGGLIWIYRRSPPP